MVEEPWAAAGARLAGLRQRHPRLGRGLDAAVALARRDRDVGGSVLSAALAVRLFLWLLPWCLLAVAALGFIGSRDTLQDLARKAGLGPPIQALLGEVGAQAAPGRWFVAATGAVLLGWATIVLGSTAERVRTGIRGAEPRPRARTQVLRSLRYSTAIGATLVVYAAAGLAHTAGVPWPVVVPFSVLALFGLGSILLGTGRSRGWWRRGLTGELVAGSLLFAVGLEAMRLVGTVYLPHKFDRSSALYGTFGVTAAILVWLALSARLIVLAHLLEASRSGPGHAPAAEAPAAVAPSSPAGPGRVQAGWTRPTSTGYLTVIVLVVATYAVSLAATGRTASVVVLLLQAVSVRVVLARSGAQAWLRRTADAAIGVALVVGAAAALVPPGPVARVLLTAVFAVTAALYLVAPAAILRDVLSADRIDGRALAGATAAYLQIGMFFAFGYQLINAVGSTPVFGTPADTGDLIFFSYVTLTTTGYGNLVPVGWAGQTLAVIEVVVGQLFLVVALGKIVTAWVPRKPARRPDREGDTDVDSP